MPIYDVHAKQHFLMPNHLKNEGQISGIGIKNANLATLVKKITLVAHNEVQRSLPQMVAILTSYGNRLCSTSLMLTICPRVWKP